VGRSFVYLLVYACISKKAYKLFCYFYLQVICLDHKLVVCNEKVLAPISSSPEKEEGSKQNLEFSSIYTTDLKVLVLIMLTFVFVFFDTSEQLIMLTFDCFPHMLGYGQIECNASLVLCIPHSNDPVV
jgi:hypothetical protein